MEIIAIILLCIVIILLIMLLMKLGNEQRLNNEQKIKNKYDYDKMVSDLLEIKNMVNEMKILSNSTILQNEIQQAFSNTEKFLNTSFNQNNDNYNKLTNSVTASINYNSTEMKEFKKSLEDKFERMVTALSNELEKMRNVVDEKLQDTLEKRLNSITNRVSEMLESVCVGFGEMKNLATNVTELKNIMSNVKTRGVIGEVFLDNILKDFLTENQYKKNYQIKENTSQRVDFVVFIPDKNTGKDLILPIDAKFPMETYLRLNDAYEKSEKDKIQECGKELESVIKKQAKSISEKYIDVPNTTDFAIMYLATEGLYSEISRRVGLVDELQRQYRILVCGPNNITAFLNALQLGFKTLTIEKRSEEMRKIMLAFRKDFKTFMELLAKSQKQVNSLSTALEDASKYTKKIEKKLDEVESLGENVEINNIDTELIS